jgi:hypothetical protein
LIRSLQDRKWQSGHTERRREVGKKRDTVSSSETTAVSFLPRRQAPSFTQNMTTCEPEKRISTILTSPFLMSLSALVKEHQIRQQLKKEDIERKKQDALVAANNLTSALVDHLNDG